MANINSETAPSKNTVGQIGDIITVTPTGERYKLVAIYTTETYDGGSTVYEWDEIIENSGSGGSGATPQQAAQIEKNKNDISKLSGEIGYLSTCVTPQMFGAIGDGMADDTAALQNAIDSLPENGGLYIPHGTYFLSTNVSISKNIHIRSCGAIITGKGFDLNDCTAHFECVNFKDITHNAISAVRCRVILQNCYFENIGISPDIDATYQGCGLYAIEDFNIFVTGCSFVHCYGHGAIFTSQNGILFISENYFIKNNYRAISLHGDFTTYKVSGTICDNVIEDGGFYNESGSGVGCNGIYGGVGHGVSVHNNNILNCVENAIEGNFLSIHDNYINGTGVDYENKPTPSTEGIYITSTPDDTFETYVKNNVIKNTHGDGIRLYNGVESSKKVFIENNRIETSAQYAININAATLNNCHIINNEIGDSSVFLSKVQDNCMYGGKLKNLVMSAVKFPQFTAAVKSSMIHYFSDMGDFTYSNTTPTIIDTDSGKAVSVPFAQYAKLIHTFEMFNQKCYIIGKVRFKGDMRISLQKNNAYSALALTRTQFADFNTVEFSTAFDATYKDKMQLFFEVYADTAIEFVEYELFHD